MQPPFDSREVAASERLGGGSLATTTPRDTTAEADRPRRSFLSLRAQLCGMIALSVVATAGAIVVLANQSLDSVALPAAMSDLRHAAVDGARSLESYVAAVGEDVQFLHSMSSVQAVARGDATPNARAEVRQRFLELLSAKPAYMLVRLIGVADSGREIIRAQRMRPNGPTELVPPSGLQVKSHRPFFRSALEHDEGKTWTSPI